MAHTINLICICSKKKLLARKLGNQSIRFFVRRRRISLAQTKMTEVNVLCSYLDIVLKTIQRKGLICKTLWLESTSMCPNC